jgi:hypothetical protein
VHHAAPEPGGHEPINPQWLADFRFDAHSGLTTDIARGPVPMGDIDLANAIAAVNSQPIARDALPALLRATPEILSR